MFQIVITDLDRALLDYTSYDYSVALPALSALKQKGIPVIFCNSKPTAEVTPLRQQMGNMDPFIVENGGDIYVPLTCFSKLPRQTYTSGDYQVIPLGVPCQKLRVLLQEISRESHLSIRSFSSLTAEKLSQQMGLSIE